MSKDLHTTDLNVPQTYFRRSHGNLVRLYHDAECLEGQFEDIETELGPFHAHSTWNDISEALENAQHFIFVAGWSVNPSISLTRSHKPVERSPLGRKAASAVERNGGGERSGGVERSGERSRGNSRQKSGEKSDKARMDKAGMTKPGMDKPGMDKPGMDKPGMDRLGMDRPGADVDNSAVENAAASCYTTDRSASVSASSPALPGHSPILSREKGAENEQPNGNDMPRSAGDMPRSANGKSEQVNGGEKGDRLLSPEVRSGRSRETIGELLKRRAEEGLSVCVVVWDDITSREGVSWLKDGLMATYDEYTREYFRDTKVEVAVVKRIAGDDLGEVSDLLKWTSFTHHQKIVVYDSENPLDRGSPRRVVGAFVGGLDLTSGRYDTAAHSPFSSLKTAHRNDFYNGCLVEATAETGPREPWHDIHARILGPAAWDVLQTYIERVSKQAPRMVHATSLKVAELRDNHLLKDGKKVLIHPDHPAAWDVQVFRSLDSEAALFENSMWTAKFGNNTHFVDRGIQQAYSYLIKKAQHYIYIENQYFLGSCQYWRQHDDVPCRNLVPWMLADRICESIACDREFCVYVLIPLFPEGAPSSVSVQEILHWQFQTMRMMYKKVATTLEEYGKTDCHPTDYLSFFFAGVREPDAKLSTTRTSLPTDVATALATKRHPIYIHSKLMMIDDEYILLGSANINERSLNGSRDTEIAVGCIQPHFRAVEDENGHVQYPNGAVRAFRLQLWHEHLDVLEPEYRECPHSSKCMRLVRGRALQNWLAYINPQMCALPYGHLCPYPLMVAQDGEVESLREHPNIPGWNASVCGSRSALLPSSLTT
ncbi:phospholipase D [Gregarina niphandrodes]|uniref:phospholipase D n=1 Tax=Gregarina niphandrodes TaxID=110365 RepID=A0A023B0M5_GRENI|nr:phospholipase D [Gregarina niphandrodes]EZG45312.1 phospholipase D [Gregarina niphandrodes]|eukprot:XP_011132527.1 phospholipase D [Gregarina niphandrodes]